MGNLTKKKQCFFFRRHTHLRMQFASAVGKRLFTERISATSKASITEHNRSIGWAQREYELLLERLNTDGGKLHLLQHFYNAQESGTVAGSDYLTHDYSSLLA